MEMRNYEKNWKNVIGSEGTGVLLGDGESEVGYGSDNEWNWIEEEEDKNGILYTKTEDEMNEE